jgi:glutamate N-acetyltransferase/amino-acid N-acetyltransferase
MAVGKDTFGTLHPVKGFRLGTTKAGVKKPDRRDLVVMEAAAGSTVAGVFTLNAFCAAPVHICKQHLEQTSGQAQEKLYLITNTGYANAGTGEPGMRNALAVCEGLAQQSGVALQSVLPFSTGVIGETLPVDRIVKGIPGALAALSEDGWSEAAHGIMTTDTRPKAVSVQLPLEGKTVTITGIAKGAGMIKPNMATMLGYVATDAAIGVALLKKLVKDAADLSFNAITIDGDTSTNDSCMLIATGQSGVAIKVEKPDNLELFAAALNDVFVQLAHAIVRDGEGATKFITVTVEQADSVEEAREVAYTVAHSPLVKTALFASDPNWGRILAAVGRANIDALDVSKVGLFLNDVLVAQAGALAPSYTEAAGAAEMQKEDIVIRIVLGRGATSANIYTTDFSYDYVKINADYRS